MSHPKTNYLINTRLKNLISDLRSDCVRHQKNKK